MDKVTSIIFYLLLSGLFILTWFIQDHLLFNSDVSWLMQATQRLLAGGHYATDFFELNPPWILYLYSPVVLIADCLGLTHEIALRAAVFLLVLCSLQLSSLTLDRILFPQHSSLNIILKLTIAAVFLFLPVNEFGQREHLLILFTLPYFLLIICRLTKKQTVYPLAIGLFAGLGFAIKPYFLISFILVEIYYCYCQRHFFGWWRVETIMVISCLITYLILLICCHPDYLYIVIPFVAQYYYRDYSSPLHAILFNDNSYFIYFTCVFFWLNKPIRQYQLANILFLTMLSFFCAYVMQRTQWYYHALPMLAYSILLMMSLFVSLITHEPLPIKKISIAILSVIALLFYFIWHMPYVSQSVYFYPKTFFGFFAILFTTLLYLINNQSLSKIIISITVVMAIAFLFDQNVQISVWRPYLFFLTITLLLLSFLLIIPGSHIKDKLKGLLFILLGMLVFCYPVYQAAYTYHYRIAYKQLYLGLVHDLKPFHHQSIMFMSDSGEFAFPAVDYTQQFFATRFPMLGNFPRLSYVADITQYKKIYLQNKNNIDFTANALAEDIRKYQPHVILVDMRGENKQPHLGYFGNDQINYLKLFMLNTTFRTAWATYHYVRTIDGQPLYRFGVYQR